MVKSDAYGLGASEVAPVLWRSGCRRFFAATPAGALAVRRSLPGGASVYVLNGLLGEPRDYVRDGLIPVLNDLDQVRLWSELAARLERPLPAVLHVDTGMRRLGLPPAELDRLCAQPGLLRRLDVHFAMSHLACADEAENPANSSQLRAFRAALARLGGPAASLANSSGIFLGGDYHFDLARPGYAVYGGNPVPGRDNPMAPVIRLSARIVQVRDVAAGETVGYGNGHTAAKATRIATIPLGYGDGYLRALGGRAVAMIGEARVPVVGRVSMDLVTLDVGALADSQARVGTWVDLVRGPDMLDELARRAGTIGYELLTALGARYPRVYLERASS